MGTERKTADMNKRRELKYEEMSEEEQRKRRQRMRARKLALQRKRRRQRMIKLVLGVLLIGILFVFVQNFDSAEEKVQGFLSAASGRKEENRKSQEFIYETEFEDFFKENTPQVRDEAEVYQRLKELAEEYSELKGIYQSKEDYPIKLLAALCNNPEMYEFVKNYPKYEAGDGSQAAMAKLTKEEKKQKYPLFLQWDKRWGYEAYGDFNIAISGCGPTALAMAATIITEEDTITPDKVAEYSMENGFYVEGTGTAWSLMTDGAKDFGLNAKEISLDESVMKQALDNGKVIICSMRKGDFTSVGHFIVIYGYDETGFKINDPNCIYRSSRTWKYEILASQIRILWSYEKK